MKSKLLGVTIEGKFIPACEDNSISIVDTVMTVIVKNGKAVFDGEFRTFESEPYEPMQITMRTKMPDGIYSQDDLTFEISDGVRDPDFPVGCYILHTKEYAKKHNIPVWV